MSVSLDTRQIIQFRNVNIQYGSKLILENASFDINKGEFVYLVGRTGTGKTTILRSLYADLLPSRGQVIVGETAIHGIDRRQIPELRRRMGIVFQDFQLLPDRTVYQNILFALKATGWRDSAKIKQRIADVLLRTGMSGKNDAMPHQLSGGQQQRVSIARALINDPLVLIADEPTGNLDPEATENVMNILRQINVSGTAVLMATHDYSLIRRYPGRVLQVMDQHLVSYPDPAEFLEKFGKV